MIFNPAPGNVPSNLPQPNSPGGGGSPTTSSPTLEESLSLVPSGLVAVSVFPPFETHRTVPAIGVIFSEPRNVGNTVIIKKKDVYRLHNHIRKRRFELGERAV